MTCESCGEKDSLISELRDELKELKQQNKQLTERVDDLTRMVWRPKQQATHPKPLGPPSNHAPHNRPLPTDIHRKAHPTLSHCPECNGSVSPTGRTRTRFVEDIAPPQPFNTEYTVPYYWCRHCNKQVTPLLPGVIPGCRFGIRLGLAITFLHYGVALPMNKIATLFQTFWGINLSEGCIVDTLTRFASFLGPEFEVIKQEIRTEAVVNKDTTAWWINGRRMVLWDFVNKRYTLLLIRNSKAQGIVYQTLGEGYGGVSISDCAKEYDYLGWAQQKCWAHLLRASRKLTTPAGKQLHRGLKELYNRAKSGLFTKEQLLSGLDDLSAVRSTNKKTRLVAARLQKYREEWFTFVDHPGVDPTNNAAERGLRPSVVMRKISGGNRSDKGAHNHEVIMSVMGTWQKQGKDFFTEGFHMCTENLQ